MDIRSVRHFFFISAKTLTNHFYTNFSLSTTIHYQALSFMEPQLSERARQPAFQVLSYICDTHTLIATKT